MNTYRHPRAGFCGGLAERLANSDMLATTRHAVLSHLPYLKLESDVTNVVYLTWLVEAGAAQAFLPAGVRLWQREGMTPFTVLTYRHGHFGPAAAGRLRRVFPSPLQSNWRLYLDEDARGALPARTVYFLKNIMSSLGYALGARIFSDVLPTHLAGRFIHRTDGTLFETLIDPGNGSAPSLACTARRTDSTELSAPFASLFNSWPDAVEFLACQDAAVTHVERVGRLALGHIELPVDLSQVVPLKAEPGAAACSLLDVLPSVGEPFCFVVPEVGFRVLSERLL